VHAGQTARTAVLVGSTQDDGSFIAANVTDISAFIASLGNTTVTPTELREVYPNRSDSEVIADAQRDRIIKWCVRTRAVQACLCSPVVD
jgi:hypothetical protein